MCCSSVEVLEWKSSDVVIFMRTTVSLSVEVLEIVFSGVMMSCMSGSVVMSSSSIKILKVVLGGIVMSSMG